MAEFDLISYRTACIHKPSTLAKPPMLMMQVRIL